MVIAGAVPLNALPSDSVPLIVPLPVTVSVKVALCPLQIVVVPLITEVGRAFTITVALPDLSPACAVQLASFSVATVKVVVVLGPTLLVIVGAVPLKALPSDSVPLIVPLPETVRVKTALWPLQIVVLPVILEVGRAFTVTTDEFVPKQPLESVTITV